jgi:Bacterial CdiA-CT RNAse A domain
LQTFQNKWFDDFGDRVKPYVEKLYREQMIELGLGKEIKENAAEIEKWLSGSSAYPLKLKTTAESPIGIILGRGKAGSVGLKTAKETTKAEIILVKDNTPNGWHILTSYPSN